MCKLKGQNILNEKVKIISPRAWGNTNPHMRDVRWLWSRPANGKKAFKKKPAEQCSGLLQGLFGRFILGHIPLWTEHALLCFIAFCVSFLLSTFLIIFVSIGFHRFFLQSKQLLHLAPPHLHAAQALKRTSLWPRSQRWVNDKFFCSSARVASNDQHIVLCFAKAAIGLQKSKKSLEEIKQTISTSDECFCACFQVTRCWLGWKLDIVETTPKTKDLS